MSSEPISLIPKPNPNSSRARELPVLLAKALRLAGNAGRPEAASEIAAEAWWALREVDPRGAERMNGVLHYLAKLPAEQRAQTPGMEIPMADPELDVRNEVPMRRHDLILGTYGELGSGEGFILVNDHDPKPLYYQFAAEYTDKFTWDYLEEGPEVWKVRIGKPS